MEKTSIIDHPEAGIILVKYEEVTLVEVFYCQDNEEEDEVQYLTRDSALEIARGFARNLFGYNAVQTTEGLSLLPKHTPIQIV